MDDRGSPKELDMVCNSQYLLMRIVPKQPEPIPTMATNEKKDEIADLLTRLKAAGAKVKAKKNTGNNLTAKMLNTLTGSTPQDFDAWVSWSKSF